MALSPPGIVSKTMPLSGGGLWQWFLVIDEEAVSLFWYFSSRNHFRLFDQVSDSNAISKNRFPQGYHSQS